MPPTPAPQSTPWLTLEDVERIRTISNNDDDANHDNDNDNDGDNADNDISATGSDEENQQVQQAVEHKGSKDDIYINKLGEESMISSSLPPGIPSTAASTSLYSPKTCTICLDNYKEKDDICWSLNKNCAHAFHLDCMMGWLMQGHDDCPLCRENYLQNTGD
mmetsp:Transcript_14253/g.20896  ORF Transcript_14253/g.20896 Transcript_14253/m.20896 type:complete len:162 (-) Transcript_14253:1435-1920(-)